PESPLMAAHEAGCAGPGTQHAFPSGRAAILACLSLAGVGPHSVVATPECVSSCVANAVGRLAQPVSFHAALGATRLGAAIVYEQWGWPLSAEALDAVHERFAGVPV